MDKLDIAQVERTAREAEGELTGVDSREALASWYERHLAKKSLLQRSVRLIGTVPVEERKAAGARLNELRSLLEKHYQDTKTSVERAHLQAEELQNATDMTMPGFINPVGNRHPLTIVERKVRNILVRMGFTIETGPEIEDDAHSFEMLNIPEGHPARDMWDTFWLEGGMLLRPHTSPVQIRAMERAHPNPLKIACPGRVYRYEEVTARSEFQFHQVEGLEIGADITMRDLVTTLQVVVRGIFGAQSKVRIRNSYFPFTEPSIEVDVDCFKCKGAGCNICKRTGWVEILGAGMVNPVVLRSCGYDPDVYSGYAFGLGLERIAMLMFEIDDIRFFTQNDLRLLSQFDKIV